jgi:uncharacterized membrane protein
MAAGICWLPIFLVNRRRIYMDLLIQRLKSKTYWVAIIGALLTVIEANSGFFGQYVPMPYRTYIVLLWPVLMLVLREVTTTALADK